MPRPVARTVRPGGLRRQCASPRLWALKAGAGPPPGSTAWGVAQQLRAMIWACAGAPPARAGDRGGQPGRGRHRQDPPGHGGGGGLERNGPARG